MLHAVKVYGVASCTKTQRATNLLQSLGVAYDYFDLAQDRHATAWVRWQNGGDEARTPTIMVGLRVLIDPTEAVLIAAVTPTGRTAPNTPVLAAS